MTHIEIPTQGHPRWDLKGLHTVLSTMLALGVDKDATIEFFLGGGDGDGEVVPPSGVEPELPKEPHFECGASASSAKEASEEGLGMSAYLKKDEFVKAKVKKPELHKLPAGLDDVFRTLAMLDRSTFYSYIRDNLNTGSSMSIHIYYNQPRDYWWLQVEDQEATCNVTGEPLPWSGRKWLLSDNMTEGEVVQTAFMALKVAEEHELRERFRYKGQAVFDPHYDINKLVELRGSEDALKERA